MEDYALQNVLEGIGYVHYLEKGDVGQALSISLSWVFHWNFLQNRQII